MSLMDCLCVSGKDAEAAKAKLKKQKAATLETEKKQAKAVAVEAAKKKDQAAAATKKNKKKQKNERRKNESRPVRSAVGADPVAAVSPRDSGDKLARSADGRARSTMPEPEPEPKVSKVSKAACDHCRNTKQRCVQATGGVCKHAANTDPTASRRGPSHAPPKRQKDTKNKKQNVAPPEPEGAKPQADAGSE